MTSRVMFCRRKTCQAIPGEPCVDRQLRERKDHSIRVKDFKRAYGGKQ